MVFDLPEVIDRTKTSRGELQLQRRGEHYEIISNGTFLMATYNGTSERLLVRTALQSVPAPLRVLIGGLGVGFSLAEALADHRVKNVTVVEVEEKIVEWNLRHLYESNQHALEDPRTEVVKADLVHWLKTPTPLFDAICLDIDNGPAWTVTEENQSLYSACGLMAVRSALTPAGAVSFWSATDCTWFVERLHECFSTVKVYEVPVDRGEPDYVYVATNES